MSSTTASARPALPAERTLRTGLLVLGAGYVAIAVFQTVDPATFVQEIGPYGAPSDHYVRDLATWGYAVGAGLLLAAGRPSWRVPVLLITVVQGALHLVNHLADIDAADRAAMGYVNAVALALLLAVEVWLLAVARRDGSAR